MESKTMIDYKAKATAYDIVMGGGKQMSKRLFRGKDIIGNWYSGNISVLEKDLHMGACTVRAGSYISNSCGSPFAYQIRPETVGQFTGLTDKNGKKIFEGDIVRFIWWWFDGAERESELTGTIVYSSDNMSFQLKGVKNKEWRDFVGADEHDMDYLTPFSELNFCDADFEIIGNIHDQKEDV